MKEVQLVIRASNVHERIMAESGFTAQIKAAAGQSDRLTSLTIATDDERRIVSEFIPTAINECAVTISRNLSPCNLTENHEEGNEGYKRYCFTFMLPENFPEENIHQLQRIIMDIVCNRSLQQWYLLVKSDDANSVAMKAQSSMILLRDMLSIRKKPQ